MTDDQIRAVIKGWRDRAERFDDKIKSQPTDSLMAQRYIQSASDLRMCASELEWLLDNSL